MRRKTFIVGTMDGNAVVGGGGAVVVDGDEVGGV